MKYNREDLENKIRKLTKRIASAKKTGDVGELENFRTQRVRLIETLAKEHDTFYWVDTEGKSSFGTKDEMISFYENNPEAAKKIDGISMIGAMMQARARLKAELRSATANPPEVVKENLKKSLSAEIKDIELGIQRIQKEIKEPETNFEKDSDSEIDGIEFTPGN